jgi:hypothetical protein
VLQFPRNSRLTDEKNKKEHQVPENKQLKQGVLGPDLVNKGLRAKVVKRKKLLVFGSRFAVLGKSLTPKISRATHE